MAGFLYIMSNPSFGARLKIGKTDRHPIHRRAELSSTGVPEPFVLEYSALVDDHHRAERLIHSALREFRPNKGREFFEVNIPDAIALIRQSCRVLEEDVQYKSPEDIRKAEYELRIRQQDLDERERRVSARQEMVSAWVRTQNKNADICRNRIIKKQTAALQFIVGGLAFFGAISLVDYSGWAAAGVIIVAWFIYNGWIDLIVSEAKNKHPSISPKDYVDSQNANGHSNIQIRCRGCEVFLNLPTGKHLNVTCPRCRTSWMQKT